MYATGRVRLMGNSWRITLAAVKKRLSQFLCGVMA